MRIIKDRIRKDVSSYEIQCIAYEPRMKLLAAGSYQEPILIYKYPYMKLFKKIIHRNRIPLTEKEIINISDDKQIIKNDAGHLLKKGNILSADHLIFTSNGKFLIITYNNGDVLIYNTTSWKKEWEHKFSSPVSSIQLIRDNSSLFIATEDWILYELALDSWEISSQKNLPAQNQGVVISNNDLTKIYVIRDKKRVASYDYETLEELHVFKGHTRGINKIALSPDEKYLVSSGMDCKLSVFNAESGELLSYLIGHFDEVHQFAFTPKGNFVLSSSEDESLRLWSLNTYKCVHSINRVPNALTMGRHRNLIFMGNVLGELRTFKTI